MWRHLTVVYPQTTATTSCPVTWRRATQPKAGSQHSGIATPRPSSRVLIGCPAVREVAERTGKDLHYVAIVADARRRRRRSGLRGPVGHSSMHREPSETLPPPRRLRHSAARRLPRSTGAYRRGPDCHCACNQFQPWMVRFLGSMSQSLGVPLRRPGCARANHSTRLSFTRIVPGSPYRSP